MAINTNPTFAFGQDLTPEQLRSMHALRGDHATQLQNIDTFGLLTESSDPYQAQIGTVGRTWDLRPGDSFSPSLTYNPGTAYTGSGESLFSSPTPDGSYIIGQAANKSTWGNSDQTGQWDADTGKWLGYSTGGTALRDFANWAATSLAAYYTMGQTPDGGGAVSGMDLAADNPGMWNVGNISAGTGATEAAGAATTAGGETAASSKAALYGAEGYGPGMTGAQTSAFDTTLGLTGSKGLAAGAAELASGGGGWLEAAKALGGSMDLGTLGKLAMAAYGASQSKDGTSTNTRDPWAPAQPFLLNQLTAGAALQDKLQQQPFSQAQQTAYGNQGNLLDAINGQMPALLAGFGANASGANQFTRGARNQRLQPVQSFNPSAYQPAGLLGYLGSR